MPSHNADAALVAELRTRVDAPTWLISRFREMTGERTYVHTDCMHLASKDAIAVNHILRNQILTLAYLGVAEPAPFVQPARQVDGRVSFNVELFAKTMEIHLAHQTHLMKLGPKIEGAVQDASTNGFSILKITLQQDPKRDPVGRARYGDMQDQFLEYARLKAANPPKDSPDYKRLKDLDVTLRVFAAAKAAEQIAAVVEMVPGMVPAVDPVTGSPVIDPITLQAVMVPGMVPDPQDPRGAEIQAIIHGEEYDLFNCPQLPAYVGAYAEQLLPDDWRYDWNVVRPEDLDQAEWQSHRCYMTRAEIQRKWGLTDDEMQQIRAPEQQGAQRNIGASTVSQDPAIRTDLEASAINDRVSVWELYDRIQFRRYVFTEGLDRFLENEPVTCAASRFFPYFFIGFNRVTGRVQPVSDVALTRNLQNERNSLRTHERMGKRGAYPVCFIGRGALEKAERALYEDRVPFAVIEVRDPVEVAKQFQETTSTPYNPLVFDTSKCDSDMAAMFGLPQVVTGANSGEDLASAIALAKEGMETGVARRRIQVNRVLTDIYQYLAQLSIQVFDLQTIQSRCGAGSVWPRLTAEELMTTTMIEVKGGYAGAPRSKDQLDLWMSATDIFQRLGIPLQGIEVARKIFDAIGIRENIERLVVPTPLPGAGVLPGGVMPVPTAPNSGPPTGQAAGPDGGAPLMIDPARGAPASLAEVPNHPPI